MSFFVEAEMDELMERMNQDFFLKQGLNYTCEGEGGAGTQFKCQMSNKVIYFYSYVEFTYIYVSPTILSFFFN